MAIRSITFSTHKFEFEHGQKPRGYGYWCFVFDRNEDETFWSTGLFSDAKRDAISWAVTKRHSFVEVAP